MQYWGKLLGVIVAVWAGAGFWGVVLGLIIGHMIDTARNNKRSRAFSPVSKRGKRCFSAPLFRSWGTLPNQKGA
ncbi:DnaJ-like protein DjlA [Serratia rubidaea]|uniref:DnaJ-like protein DjlA n=1 Tax=Serratia rubidaea TaxID=61652 RepID=A0A3S4JSY4_SERRU|nr:DnaJ-like protein DjlA [Serratia rubidaea]